MKPDVTEHRCLNKRCQVPVSKPGKCRLCKEAWEHTCRVALNAHQRQRELDEREWAPDPDEWNPSAIQ